MSEENAVTDIEVTPVIKEVSKLVVFTPSAEITPVTFVLGSSNTSAVFKLTRTGTPSVLSQTRESLLLRRILSLEEATFLKLATPPESKEA